MLERVAVMVSSGASARWFGSERFPIVLLMTALAFSACLMPAQPDTWWQLRAGEEMWHSGRIMLHDEFTHTVAGRHWPNHEWLSQVVFFGAYHAGGMAVLTALCALAVTLAWTVAGSLTPGTPLVRVAIIGVGAVLSAGGWTLRPQALTMALFAITLWIVVHRRRVWLLPALFLVWANLHGAVALGAVLIVASALASLILRDGFLRTWVLAGTVCFAATLITPLGWALWLEMPASLRRLQAYGVMEWRPPGLAEPIDIAFWIVGVAVVALMIARRREALRSRRALTLAIATLLLFVLATRSIRNVPPFALVAVPTLGSLLPWRREPREDGTRTIARHAVLLGVAGLVAILFIGHAWSAPLPRLHWDPLPAQTIAAISGCDGRLYNRYDEGGYLIWFMKDRKVFIDNRQDPFPEELVLQHIEVERSGDYRAMFARYDIRCALTPRESVLARSLRLDGWQERGGAYGWAVYRRPSGRAALN